MNLVLPFILVFGSLLLMADSALAIIVSVANPRIATEIGVRTRNGLNGAEVVMFDSRPTAKTVGTLNPTGAPVWTYGQPYRFAGSWNSNTGNLSFSVDFNKSGIPGDVSSGTSRESLTYVYPEFVGSGFTNISLVAQGRSSSGVTMNLSNLVFNGSSVSSFTSVGNAATTKYYASSTPGEALGSINFSGEMTLSGDGGTTRPQMELRLSGPVSLIAPIPEPGVFGLAALGGLYCMRRRSR